MKFDASQQRAIDRATSSRVSIITGGAGSGKTTLIKAITETLETNGETVALAAFAGKAAARVREACQHPASTIHRMLGYDGKRFNAGDLRDTSVILDESSMIDSQLMAEIVTRNPRRLILVGDQAQLPPVGRGQPFHDLIAMRPDLVSTLTTCYRATEAVFQAASTIRGGGRPPMCLTTPGEHWEIRNTGDRARTQAQILEWVTADGWDFERDILLVARNGESNADPCTVRGLNAAITDALAPRDTKTRLVVGDRVMNTKNMPDLDVWNGTTGTVHAVDQDGGIWVRTDVPVINVAATTDERNPKYTSHVLFGKDRRGALQLAYAVTVHKSQGSQFRNVIVACFDSDTWGLLDRSLLYTGVTRTQSTCVVVGQASAVWRAVDLVHNKQTVMQRLAAECIQ